MGSRKKTAIKTHQNPLNKSLNSQMVMNIADTVAQNTQLINQLIEWYWTHGSKRVGQFQLSRSGFLSPLFDLKRRLESVPESTEAQSRGVFGLWGPSQVGKSTLLSEFLDQNADELGHGSILQWSDNEPVRFERSDSDPSARPLSLNPYNFKADASACISRFTLVGTVPAPRCPVEIKLAEPAQLLHALALGYLYDWQRNPIDDQKRASEILANLTESAIANRTPDHKGFALAQIAASVLRLLKSSRLEHQRYQSLADDHIDGFLDHPIASSSSEVVLKAICDVFWDSEQTISNLFTELLKAAEFYSSFCNRIYCSYEVAALLLDMQSYLSAEGGMRFDGDQVNPDEILADKILKIGRKLDNQGNMFLEVGSGDAAFNDLFSYALLQSAVWELVIPINKKRLESFTTVTTAGTPDAIAFRDLLSQTDILDFPGVSNIGQGGDDRIFSSVIQKKGQHLLFSHLVKRGKTSAMVAASASRSHVDGFCLLVRAQSPLARPGILNDSMRSWQSEFTGRNSPVVNVLVTFFGDLIKDAIRNPDRTSFKGAFNGIDALSSSFIETGNVFPVCFHKYEDLIPKNVWDAENGDPVVGETLDKIEEAAGRLVEDDDFSRLFGTDINRVLDAACVKEGGVSSVVGHLISQTRNLNKNDHFKSLVEGIQFSLLRLLEMARPGKESELERKKHLLEKIGNEIQKKIKSNGSYSDAQGKKVSYAIRSFVTFNENELDSVPLRVARSPESGKLYLLEQVQKWAERQSRPHPDLGIRNPSDAANLANYVAAGMSLPETLHWLTENFGTITRANAAQDARRYLSVCLTEQILPRPEYRSSNDNSGKGQLSPESIVQMIASAEAGQSSSESCCPHYLGVIAPFLERLVSLTTLSIGERPEQEGDKELIQLLEPTEENHSQS